MQETDKKILLAKKAEILKIRKDEEARKRDLITANQAKIGVREQKALEGAELLLAAAKAKTTGKCQLNDGPEIAEKKTLSRIPIKYESAKVKVPRELSEMKEDFIWYLQLRSEIKVTVNCLLTIAKTETFVEGLKRWEVEKKSVGDGNLFKIGQDLRAIGELVKKGMTWITCHSMMKLQRRLFEHLELEEDEPIKPLITATDGKTSRQVSQIIKHNNDQKARRAVLNLAKCFDEATQEVTGRKLDRGWFLSLIHI